MFPVDSENPIAAGGREKELAIAARARGVHTVLARALTFAWCADPDPPHAHTTVATSAIPRDLDAASIALPAYIMTLVTSTRSFARSCH